MTIEDVKETFTKKNFILYVMVLIQVYLFTFYMQFVEMYTEQKQVFERVETFEAVSAKCVKVEKNLFLIN